MHCFSGLFHTVFSGFVFSAILFGAPGLSIARQLIVSVSPRFLIDHDLFVCR